MEETKKTIVFEAKKVGFILNSQIAYILATVEHETAHTFKPVREAFWLSENWRKANLRYYPFYGRGFVQITWKSNYEKFAKLTGKDLVNNPDLAMEFQTALFILLYGFKNGSFTGKKLSDYVNTSATDFVNARRCINGIDRAKAIGQTANHYLELLNTNKL